MAAADAPLRTSMLSMSLGLMSAMRLTWLSWVGFGLEPPTDSVTAYMPEAMATSLTSTPSMTYSGAVEPLMVDTPRRRSWMPPPGAPEFCWMLAPAILPDSAWSTV